MTLLLLLMGWILFGVLHSVLASGRAKAVAATWLGRYFKYYRLAYNLLSLVLMLGLFYYQLSQEKLLLWSPGLGSSLAGAGLAGIGLGVLLLALRQYNMAEFGGWEVLGGAEGTLAPPLLRTQGLLRLVRHPLYTGTLLVVWGLWLLEAGAAGLVTAASVTLYIRIGIYYEEKKLIRTFGQQYLVYRQRTPMLFPQLRTS
jgi:methanethiol S-methyltransferase